MTNRRHRLHLVTPTAWPEAPAPDYVRTMTDYVRAAGQFPALYIADPEQMLQDEHWRQQILMRQRRDDRIRARVWIGIFIAFGIIAGTLIAIVAHMETAVHVSGGVNG